MAHTLDGANTTAQFFQSEFAGKTFHRLDKFVLHTTETEGWPGYQGGAAAPNATYHPRKRQIRQHFTNNRSSRALKDGNRENVFQLEVVCYSEKAKGDTVGGLWVADLSDEHYEDIAQICVQLHEELGLPLETSVEWHEGRATSFNDVRLSSTEYTAYRGILGHAHVPKNSHWDPGGFRISRLMAALEESDMPISDNDAEKIANKTWSESLESAATGALTNVKTVLNFARSDALEAKANAAVAKTNSAEALARLTALEARLAAQGELLQQILAAVSDDRRPPTPPG